MKHALPADPGAGRRFLWHETASVLRELEADAGGARLRPVPRGFTLRAPGGRVVAEVRLPLVLRTAAGATADEVVRDAGQPLGRELVLLLRAGAAALGCWRDGELIAHKTFRRYVVRGHGKAQPTFLERRGKSRYGSRLRLQNARRLLQEVNERANAWADEAGGLDAVYVSCPERTWPEVLAADPPPRFLCGRDPIRIPLHVHRPDHAELLRVRWELERGVVTGGEG